MSFHTISNILNGAVSLQTAIDNSNYDKRVGIRSLTVWIGWYNTGEDSWMGMVKIGPDAGEDDGDPNTGVGFSSLRKIPLNSGLRGARDIVKLGGELL